MHLAHVRVHVAERDRRVTAIRRGHPRSQGPSEGCAHFALLLGDRGESEELAREREAADRLARDINAEVEGLILGTKKVSEL